MAFVNDNYCNLKDSYLFSQIAQKVNAYVAEHPEKKVIRMGIGDVTLPLAPAVIDAMQKAVAEMGVKETFRGYGPEQGYDFLHEAIVKYYAGFGVTLASDEIFISDGAKSDCGNITDIFSNANTILIPDPVYPVYLDTNIMCGRKIVYMDGKPENNFLPMPDDSVKADIIYLCSPNNPTGAVYTKEQLEAWVAYALKNDAVILYDAAYEAFVDDPAIPRSIFVVEDARKCAIELCSLSKTAGFTGTRCGYTVVPHALVRKTESGKELELNKMWLRRQTTKFNGVPYIIQRGAEAVFSEQGKRNAAKCWLSIKKMPGSWPKDCAEKALNSTAGPIHPIFGCNARRVCLPGNSLISCLKNWLLSVLPAPVLALWAKDTSACPLLAAVKTLSKQWNALKKNCKQNNKNAWFLTRRFCF